MDHKGMWDSQALEIVDNCWESVAERLKWDTPQGSQGYVLMGEKSYQKPRD
jgi:hypothetical protein